MVVSSLYRYPVKAMRGQAATSLTLDARGPVGDRRYMVVDSSGRFLSQRQVPRLALASPSLMSDGLEIQAEGVEPLRVSTPTGAARPAVIWQDTVLAQDAGDEAAAWLERLLRRPARLVYQGDEGHRPVDAKYAPFAHAQTSLADAYPLLLTTEASLRAVQSWLTMPIDVRRFRPNVVVSGAEAWAEDAWHELVFSSGLVVWGVKPCVRCVVVDTDPLTGERWPGPLEALRQHHASPGKGPVFGMNAVHASEGIIHLNESLVVRSTASRDEWALT
jgi:uncharacterized protein